MVVDNNEKEYRFDSFIIDKSNKFVAEVVKKIMDIDNYSLLLVYGDIGVGKTHLVTALKNKINNEQKVIQISSEKYIDEFVSALKDNTTIGFREKYLDVDLLILEDIQFLIGKNRVQQELQNMICELLEKKKKLILTSNISLKEPIFDKKFQSIIQSGLYIEIGNPTNKLKLEIIKSLEQESNVKLDHRTKRKLTQETNDIRILKGHTRTEISKKSY